MHLLECSINLPDTLFHVIWEKSANSSLAIGQILTGADEHPDEIEEKVIKPEVITLRPTEGFSVEVKVKQARSVVKDVAIDLTDGEQQLESMTCRMLHCDAVGDKEGQGSPTELFVRTISIY